MINNQTFSISPVAVGAPAVVVGRGVVTPSGSGGHIKIVRE
jgi:hypothetical protein